jgi:hypothetical protein
LKSNVVCSAIASESDDIDIAIVATSLLQSPQSRLNAARHCSGVFKGDMDVWDIPSRVWEDGCGDFQTTSRNA